MILKDITEEHFEELEILFGQRKEALTSSSEVTSQDLLDLEERLSAHLEGVLFGEGSIASLLEHGLSSEEGGLVFVSAYILLQLNTESSAKQLLDGFKEASGDRLRGSRDAMCHGPIDHLAQQLHDILGAGPPVLASAAGEVLAFHKQLNPNASRLHEFFSDEDPEVRKTGWRILKLLA